MSGRWVTRLPGRDPARVRLACFPHAGAGAAAYRPWRALLPPDVELVLVHLPGREARLGEPPARRLEALMPPLLAALAPELAPPYALFGHSMGALLAFEAARRLPRPPAHLFVSGLPAPHLPPTPPLRHALPDDALLREYERLGGTPPELLAHRELMALLLPVFRADLELVETRPLAPPRPLECPVTAFVGDADPLASVDDVRAWREQAPPQEFDLRVIPGGHFYLHARAADLIHEIASQL